jgi:hypothetical protein
MMASQALQFVEFIRRTDSLQNTARESNDPPGRLIFSFGVLERERNGASGG